MTWEATFEEEILELVGAAWGVMTAEQKLIWEKVKIPPEKWPADFDLSEFYVVEDIVDVDEDVSGFWVVAVFESTVLWYNDIEEGFNLSNYRPYGYIAQYGNKQDDLEVAFQQAIDAGQIPSELAIP